jgi:hypothetical protein
VCAAMLSIGRDQGLCTGGRGGGAVEVMALVGAGLSAGCAAVLSPPVRAHPPQIKRRPPGGSACPVRSSFLTDGKYSRLARQRVGADSVSRPAPWGRCSGQLSCTTPL